VILVLFEKNRGGIEFESTLESICEGTMTGTTALEKQIILYCRIAGE
jgi:hypothetical protein